MCIHVHIFTKEKEGLKHEIFFSRGTQVYKNA